MLEAGMQALVPRGVRKESEILHGDREEDRLRLKQSLQGLLLEPQAIPEHQRTQCAESGGSREHHQVRQDHRPVLHPAAEVRREAEASGDEDRQEQDSESGPRPEEAGADHER